MSNQANFASTPIAGAVLISTANTARDGTGTMGTVLAAGAAGSRIDRVSVAAIGTTTAGMVRLFLHNGTAAFLLMEIPVTAVASPGATVVVFARLLSDLGIVVPTGWSLRASTHNAESFHVMAYQAGELLMNPGLLSGFTSPYGGTPRKLSALINEAAAGQMSLATGTVRGARALATTTYVAGVLQTVLQVNGAGKLNFVAARTGDATTRTMRVRVTLDGQVAIDATSTAVSTQALHLVAVGAIAPTYDGATVAAVAIHQPLAFYASCVVEVASSLSELGAFVIPYVNAEVN